MKKKSVIRKAFFMMTVHFILLLVVFFSYLFFSYHTAVGNLRDGMENLIQIYGRELENKINNADMLLERLIYANDEMCIRDRSYRHVDILLYRTVLRSK